MPGPNATSHAEAKRLAKAVKRRRTYAENLKRSVAQIRNDEPTDDQLFFAGRLEDLADAELALARADETRAKSLNEVVRQPAHPYSSVEMKERAERAREGIKGKMTIDRVRHLLAELGQPNQDAGTGDGMDLVEALMGTKHLGDRPQLGVRVSLAETTLFGAPRF